MKERTKFWLLIVILAISIGLLIYLQVANQSVLF